MILFFLINKFKFIIDYFLFSIFYVLCISIVTHEDRRLPEDIFHRAYMATWLFRLLRSSNYLPENVKTADSADSRLSDEELFIAGLLLHNLQLLQFNSHEVRTTHNVTLKFARLYFIIIALKTSIIVFVAITASFVF